jgi:hypothetical protein
MNINALAIVLITISSSALSQTTSAPTCKIDPVEQGKLKEIADRYELKFKKVGQDTDSRTKVINEESNDTRITGHFETRRLDYKLDLPEVTMKDQKFAFDFPEVTMRTQGFSYDFIETRVENQCTVGPDELRDDSHTCDEGKPWAHTCHDFRTVRGKDICIPTTVRMKPVRQEIKLDVPEVKMVRKEFVIGIPELTMKTQRQSFDYPVYIIDSIESRNSAAKKKADDAKNDATGATASLTSAMKAEMRAITQVPLQQGYECQLKLLDDVARQQSDILEIAAVAAAAGLKVAQEKNIPSAIAFYQKSLKAHEVEKERMIADFSVKKQEAVRKYKDQLAAL